MSLGLPLMNPLNASDMLVIWEQGLNQPLLQRALILLVAACPELSPKALAELSIGQRDQRLLKLRESLFGTQMLNTAVCPACSERMEWQNQVADLGDASVDDQAAAQEFELALDDYQLRFRLPNSLDLVAVIKHSDSAKAQQALLARCLLKAECAGIEFAFEQLPEPVIQALEQRLEALDPNAEILMNLHCPVCSHNWAIRFDIADFLWQEINDWAERMLQMVHTLALNYGWSERQILQLSPVRRQLYLGMLGA